MRIKEVTLHNFRSHQNTTLALDRITMLRGLNAAGKSSVQMAIELALTGRCAATDAAGRGSESLIREGAQSLEVKLMLGLFGADHVAEIVYSRNQTGATQRIGERVNTHARAWIEQYIAPIGVLSAVLNAGRFLELAPKEQKALLAQALANEAVEIPEDTLALMRQIPEVMIATKVASAADVDAYHKSYFELRTQTNRDLKALGELREFTVPDSHCLPEQIAKSLKELRGQRDGVLAEKARITRTSEQERTRYQAATAQKKQYEPKIADGEELDRLRKLVSHKEQAVELDQAIAGLEQAIVSGRNDVAKLKGAPELCPTCNRKLADDAIGTRTAMAGELERSIAEREAVLEQKRAARRKLGDVAAAEVRLAEHRDAVSKCNAADEILNGGDPGTVDMRAIEDKVAHLDTRIANEEAALRESEQTEIKLNTLRVQQKRREGLAAAIGRLDRLVDAFGDKGGLKAKLVGGKLAAFRRRINDVLASFGFSCSFELEPYSLQVMSANQWMGLNQLSESEAYRFGIAFQVALAEATGVGFVIVDRADMLDSFGRNALTAELLASRLEQAIVLSTGEPLPEYPEIPCVAFYELIRSDESGTTAVRAIEKSPTLFSGVAQ